MASQFDIDNPDFRSTPVEPSHWMSGEVGLLGDAARPIFASAQRLITLGSQSQALTEEDIRILRQIVGIVEEV